MVIFRQLDKNTIFLIEIKNFQRNFLKKIFFLVIKTIDYQKKQLWKIIGVVALKKANFAFLTNNKYHFFIFFIYLKCIQGNDIIGMLTDILNLIEKVKYQA